jgi:hypothetical protein
MKRYTYLAVCVIGAMALHAGAMAAGRSGGDFDALIARVHTASKMTSQSAYSQQLHKSVNAAAIRHLQRTCKRKHPGGGDKTFTLMGVMRLDGVLKAPVPLPEDAFTKCMASEIGSVNFPLPPGKGHGWPVAMQFDARTGKVLYMAGDRQSAMPMYGASRQWMYTPVPAVPSGLHKSCAINVWVTVGVHGRIGEVDVADSSCPATLKLAVIDAARQWIYIGAPGSKRTDSMDLRLSFNIGAMGVRVKL